MEFENQFYLLMKSLPSFKCLTGYFLLLCSSLLSAQTYYTNDWQTINATTTPPGDVYSITVGNEFMLIPVNVSESARTISGAVFYGYQLNHSDFIQRSVVRSASIPSGGEQILGWGSNQRHSFLLTAAGNNLYLEKVSIAANGSVELTGVTMSGNVPAYSAISSCIFTQSGVYLSAYDPDTSRVYMLNLTNQYWVSKPVSGDQPDNLPGITSFGWKADDGNCYVGIVGGENTDGTASNQGYYLNLTAGTAIGMSSNPENGGELEPYGDGTSNLARLSFRLAYASAVVVMNYYFGFGEKESRNIVALAGFRNTDGTLWNSDRVYPTSLQSSSKMVMGDISKAFTDESWWGNSSRTDLPQPRSGGNMQKVSVNGKATLLYYGGRDAAGNSSQTLYRLDTEAPYVAHGALPKFGLDYPLTLPYERAPLHYFSRNDNPSHLFTAVQSEVDSVNTNLAEYFTYEGISHWVVGNYTRNSMPVYRMYNSLSGAHFYTASFNEVLTVMETLDFFSLEGVGFFVFLHPEPGTMPVYRFWVPETASHYFTISEAEKNQLVSSGQQVRIYEGIAWYAYPSEN